MKINTIRGAIEGEVISLLFVFILMMFCLTGFMKSLRGYTVEKIEYTPYKDYTVNYTDSGFVVVAKNGKTISSNQTRDFYTIKSVNSIFIKTSYLKNKKVVEDLVLTKD